MTVRAVRPGVSAAGLGTCGRAYPMLLGEFYTQPLVVLSAERDGGPCVAGAMLRGHVHTEQRKQ